MPRIVKLTLVGRPNAGKSSLLNYLIRKKLSVVSPKANTTRFSLSGSYWEGETEVRILDTPGWEQTPKGRLGKVIATAAQDSLATGEVIALVIDGARHSGNIEKDRFLYERAEPREVIMTKSDLVRPRQNLLLKIEQVRSWGYTGRVRPLSSRSGRGVEEFRQALLTYARPRTPEDENCPSVTKQKFAEECVRQEAFKLLNQELPYNLWVETRWIKEEGEVCTLEQEIKVLLPRHKPIVLGAGGQMIKRIGSRARAELIRQWGQKVNLFLQVVVGKEKDLLASCTIYEKPADRAVSKR